MQREDALRQLQTLLEPNHVKREAEHRDDGAENHQEEHPVELLDQTMLVHNKPSLQYSYTRNGEEITW